MTHFARFEATPRRGAALDFSVRVARVDEAEALATIEQHIRADGTATTAEAIREAIADPAQLVLLAESGETPVGQVLAEAEQDDDRNSQGADPPTTWRALSHRSVAPGTYG